MNYLSEVIKIVRKDVVSIKVAFLRNPFDLLFIIGKPNGFKSIFFISERQLFA